MTDYSYHDAVMALIEYSRSIVLLENVRDDLSIGKATKEEVRVIANDAFIKHSTLCVIGDYLREVEDSPECFGCSQHLVSTQTIDGLTLCPTCEPRRDEIAARLWDRQQEDLSRVS